MDSASTAVSSKPPLGAKAPGGDTPRQLEATKMFSSMFVQALDHFIDRLEGILFFLLGVFLPSVKSCACCRRL